MNLSQTTLRRSIRLVGRRVSERPSARRQLASSTSAGITVGLGRQRRSVGALRRTVLPPRELHYNPDPRRRPAVRVLPRHDDTFNIAENRSANIYGIKLDYTLRPTNELEFKFGTLSSITPWPRGLLGVQRDRHTGPAVQLGSRSATISASMGKRRTRRSSGSSCAPALR